MEAGMDSGALVAVVFWIFVGVVSVTPMILKYLRSRDAQKSINLALSRDREIPPDLLLRPPPPKANDIRGGVILIAVAAGLLVFAYVFSIAMANEMGERAVMVARLIGGGAAIPGLLGVALLILGLTGVGQNKP
jgi:Domain of unknown function (DUF6249)